MSLLTHTSLCWYSSSGGFSNLPGPPPDDDCEDLSWIRFVEVQKGRFLLTLYSIMRAGDLSAHGPLLPHEPGGPIKGVRFLNVSEEREQQEGNCRNGDAQPGISTACLLKEAEGR